MPMECQVLRMVECCTWSHDLVIHWAMSNQVGLVPSGLLTINAMLSSLRYCLMGLCTPLSSTCGMGVYPAGMKTTSMPIYCSAKVLLCCMCTKTWSNNKKKLLLCNSTYGHIMNAGNLTPDNVQPNITVHLPECPFTQRLTVLSLILLNMLRGAGSKSMLVSSKLQI